MLTAVSEKEKAAVTPTTTSSKSSSQLKDDELEALRQASRGKGRESEAAIAKRLSQVSWR